MKLTLVYMMGGLLMKGIVKPVLFIMMGFIAGEVLFFVGVSNHISYILMTVFAVTGVYLSFHDKRVDKKDITIEQNSNDRNILVDASLKLSESSNNMYFSTGTIYDTSHKVFKATEDLLESIGRDNNNILCIKDELDTISAGIKNIHNDAESTREYSTRNMAAVRVGEEMVNKMDESIKDIVSFYHDFSSYAGRLMKSSRSIYDVIGYINDISSQTHMLSINASIEAARAGEYGRGFSIVAKEIKKLAQQSKSHSDSINLLLKRIEDDIRSIQLISTSGSEKIGPTEKALSEINGGLKTIVESSQALDDKIAGILQSTQYISVTSGDTIAKVHGLTESHEITYSSMQEVAADMAEEWKSIEKLNGITTAVAEVTNRFLNLYIDRDVEEKLKSIGRKILAYDGDKSIKGLKLLCTELGINDIFYANDKGIFEYSSNNDAIGFNVFDVEESRREFVQSGKEIEIYPLSRNMKTGKLFKYIAVKRKDKPGFISAEISLKSILDN